MAWDEWEQLKAEALEKRTARMQLNQVDPGDGLRGLARGGDPGVLKASQTDLAAIGSKAHKLYAGDLAKLAKKGPERLTNTELARFNKSMGKYRDDPLFAEKFATTLGADKTGILR